MSSLTLDRPTVNRKRPRLRVRRRPASTARLDDGRVIATATPSGVPIDQHPAPRFQPSAPIEPPIVDRPEPRPEDLDAAEPWYKAAPWDPELDATFYGLPMTDLDLPSGRAMRLDPDEDSERFPS